MRDLVITATSGDVKVVRTLWGLVTQERLEWERKDVAYRAEQLDLHKPTHKFKRREIDTYEREWGEYEQYEENTRFKQGRRSRNR